MMAPGEALAIAARSDPAPLSLVLVTVIVPARAGQAHSIGKIASPTTAFDSVREGMMLNEFGWNSDHF